MGNILNIIKNLFGNFFHGLKYLLGRRNEEERRILVLGLSGSGKTTLLKQLSKGETIVTIPKIINSIQSLQVRNIQFISWGVSFQIRKGLMIHYYEGINGLIYVVDASYLELIQECSLELEKILMNDELRNVPLLVLANKQDIPNTISTSELSERLGLYGMSNRPWNVLGSCAVTGEGVQEAMEWLENEIRNNRR